MPSRTLVRCDCERCLQGDPNGREMSAVVRSRHRRNQGGNTALALLDEAERAVTTKLVAQAIPSIFGSGGGPSPSTLQTDAKTATVTAGLPPPSILRDACTQPRKTRSLQNIDEYQSTIHSISLSIIREANSISRPEALHFVVDPDLEHQDHWQRIHEELQLPQSMAQCHKHHFVLRISPENQEFLRSEIILREALDQVDTFIYTLGSNAADTAAILDSAHKARKVAIDALSQLMTWKQTIWTERATIAITNANSCKSGGKASYDVVDTGRFLVTDTRNHSYHPLVLSSVVHVVLSNLVFGMPVKGCETLLEGFRYNTQLAVGFSQGTLPSTLPERVPKSLVGAFQHLDLNPTLRQYLVCPKCHSLTPAVQPYPTQCRNRPVPGEPGCQSPLLMERRINGRAGYSPIKMYLHQDFRMWLARFLSRPGIEAIIRASQHPFDTTEDGRVTDILGSRAILSFHGVDNMPFVRLVQGQYRLLFALSVDGFNPLTNKVAKQVRTSTGIYLICLNLPLAIRQLPHNMYLAGVAPGPNKPKEGELNHYLRLVVDDFKPFWDTGVLYTSTALNQSATLCFAAIVPVICDALGAREVSGFPTITSAQFCIYCSLSLRDIENFDLGTWPKRTCAAHKRLAEEWRTAPLSARLDMQKNSHPARYSSLLQLPYFDPIRFTVIDTMHLLYLGLFERHCRSVWGMNVKLEDGDGSKRGSGAIPAPPVQEDMDVGRLILSSGDPEEFFRRSIRKDVLYYLCEENGLRTGGKKRDLINELRGFMTRSSGDAMQGGISKVTESNPAGTSSHRTATASSPPSAKRPLSLQNTPTVTDKIKEEFQLVEARLAKNLSLQKCHVEPLRIMCFLRDLAFESQKPVKREMIAALLSWRTKQADLHQWIPTMHLSQLETLANAQTTQASRQDEVDASSRGRQTRDGERPISDNSQASRVPLHEPPPSSGNVDAQVPQKKSRRSKRSQSAVLGSGVMGEYAVDRRNMVLPTWITAPPARAGHANHGKMSADQWRVFCTVNLPVTLIRVWSVRQSEPRWNEMLLNFLDLVLAVEIASLVVTTNSLIQYYEKLMHRYLTSLKLLYKDAPIVQNQHIALHVGEVMRDFGPTPGYRSFGTERFNYTLQQVNTNRHEFGEIEMIMTRSVCRASNLIALLEHPHALPQHLQSTVSKALKRDERGTRVNDVPSSTPDRITSIPQYTNPTSRQSKLTKATLEALIAHLNRDGAGYVAYDRPSKRSSETYIYPDVTFSRVFRVGGTSYRPCQRSLGSSHALVKMEDGSYRPGQIQAMFRHARDGVDGRQEEDFVAVCFLKPLSDADRQLDPYRAVNAYYKKGPFQDAFGSLWSERLEEGIVIIRPHDLICHFARTSMRVASISMPCYHVQALARIKTQFELNGWMRENDGSDAEMDEDRMGADNEQPCAFDFPPE